MKRIEYMRTLGVEDYLKNCIEDNEYNIVDMACKRKMQVIGEGMLLCQKVDADNCFPHICRGCIAEYLNEEVDKDGNPVNNTGKADSDV